MRRMQPAITRELRVTTRSMAPLVASLLAPLVLAGCGFEPGIDPLVISTAPSNPFSEFAPTIEPVDSIPPAYAPENPELSPVAETARIPEFPDSLAWIAGVLAVVASALSGLTFLRHREADRPPIFPLIFIAVLITVVTILVELLFVAAEIIMLLSGIGETPQGVVLGLILAVLGLFLINFDLAFVIYVYRVGSAPAGEDVRVNLRFWEGWGLSQPDEGK